METAVRSSVQKIVHVVREIAETSNRCILPTIVAVSKAHPPESVCHAYEAGLRHFGENYVQELLNKAQSVQEKCKDIKWHFIGHLQRNKTKTLAEVPNLWMIETVDNMKTARSLNTTWGLKDVDTSLRVLVQVNTSQEERKYGCSLKACEELVQFIDRDCKHLLFCGLMTIGRPGHDPLTGPNPDFVSLIQCGVKVQQLLDRPLEFSMGMSADFCHAIQLGSTIIRVGAAIFGPRGTRPSHNS